MLTLVKESTHMYKIYSLTAKLDIIFIIIYMGKTDRFCENRIDVHTKAVMLLTQKMEENFLIINGFTFTERSTHSRKLFELCLTGIREEFSRITERPRLKTTFFFHIQTLKLHIKLYNTLVHA